MKRHAPRTTYLLTMALQIHFFPHSHCAFCRDCSSSFSSHLLFFFFFSGGGCMKVKRLIAQLSIAYHLNDTLNVVIIVVHACQSRFSQYVYFFPSNFTHSCAKGRERESVFRCKHLLYFPLVRSRYSKFFA